MEMFLFFFVLFVLATISMYISTGLAMTIIYFMLICTLYLLGKALYNWIFQKNKTVILFKKGQHWNRLHFSPYYNTSHDYILTRRYIFDDNSIYEYADKRYNEQVNKLFGLNFNLLKSHKNSVRFGWNCNNDSINIFAYIYKNGERKIYNMTKIDLHEEYQFKIRCFNNQVFFYIERKINNYWVTFIVYKIDMETISKFGYICNEYFGGEQPAPEDVSFIRTFKN